MQFDEDEFINRRLLIGDPDYTGNFMLILVTILFLLYIFA